MSQAKRAYMVVGPEASGTRLVTEILLYAGCFGDDSLGQLLDERIPHDQDLLVWRRSYPHGRGNWPSMSAMVEQLHKAGHRDIRVIVCMRDWHSLLNAQIRNGKHQPTIELALQSAQRSYKMIFRQIANLGLPYWMVSYEALVQRPEVAQAAFLEMIGLKMDVPVLIHDANAKYYKEG